MKQKGSSSIGDWKILVSKMGNIYYWKREDDLNYMMGANKWL
jgi:hypothetical protein